MTSEEFAKLVEAARTRENALLQIKGKDYAEGMGGTVKDDRLANFKVIDMLLAGAPLDATTVAMIYGLKHVIALCKIVRERTKGSEPVESRFTDAANYLYLIEAALHDTNPGLFEYY